MENFDEFMRQKFDNDDPAGRFPFREEYWDQALALLEAEERKKKRRFLWWWWFFGAMLLCGGGWAAHGWWTGRDEALRAGTGLHAPASNAKDNAGNDVKSVGSQLVESNEAKEAKEGTNTEKTDKTAGAEKTTSGVGSVSTAKTNPTKQTNADRIKDNSAGNTSGNISGNTLKTKGGKTGSTKKGNVGAADKTTIPQANNLGAPVQNTMPGNNKPAVLTQDTMSARHNASDLATATMTDRQRDSVQYQKALTASMDLLAVALHQPVTPENKPAGIDTMLKTVECPIINRYKEPRWSLGLLAEVNGYPSLTNGRAFGGNMGVEVAYRIRPDWALEAGVRYQINPLPVIDTLDQNQHNQLRYSFGYIKEQFFIERKYVHSLEVPLGISWRKSKFSLRAGAAAGIFVAGRGTLASTQTSSLEPDPLSSSKSIWLTTDKFHKAWLTPYAGLEWAATRKLSLRADVRYRMSGLQKSTIEFEGDPAAMYLAAGLKWKF